MQPDNPQIRIHSLATGPLTPDHFALTTAPIPRPAEGEVLCRTRYLSLDPYMRKRLGEAAAGRLPIAVGDLMMGRTIGEVVESRDPRYQAGDFVLGAAGWQTWSAEPASTLRKLSPDPATLTRHLGVLGPTGITAWLGMVHVGRVQAGDRVVVSSAAGAVGGTAGQIARHLGAEVIGIAGGSAKCDAVVRELGFAAGVDYRQPDFEESLARATPGGVDLCFENVGGAVLDATLARMNDRGRIAICGLLSHYDGGAPYALRHFARVLDKGLQITGFSVNTHTPLHERARAELGRWLDAGALRQWETITEGLEQAPQALIAMLAGQGRGKHLVQLAH